MKIIKVLLPLVKFHKAYHVTILVGLKHLKHLDMNSCCYITDLTMLKEVADSLQYLDIGKCESISDVSPVQNLRYLAFIYLSH